VCGGCCITLYLAEWWGEWQVGNVDGVRCRYVIGRGKDGKGWGFCVLDCCCLYVYERSVFCLVESNQLKTCIC
jgi:hypothetical protein